MKKRVPTLGSSEKDLVYTKKEILEEIGDSIYDYIQNRDIQFIDFSAGDDHLCTYLRSKSIECTSYDIRAAPTVICKNWFEVIPPEPPRACIIGLNPPFSCVSSFFNHSLKFKPLRIYMIVPRKLKSKRVTHYKRIHKELLDAHSTFRTAYDFPVRNKYGVYLVVWEYDETYVPILKKRFQMMIPPYVSFHNNVDTWEIPNCLFIRKVGYAPGLQLVWSTENNEYLLLSPNTEFQDFGNTKDLKKSINNNVSFYCGIQGKWKIENKKLLLTTIQEYIRTLDIQRRKYMFPILKKKHIQHIINTWIQPQEIKILPRPKKLKLV